MLCLAVIGDKVRLLRPRKPLTSIIYLEPGIRTLGLWQMVASGLGRALNLVLASTRSQIMGLAVVINMAKRIVIIGAGGHGSVVWDTIAEISATALESILAVGWIDDIVSGSRYGIPVLGTVNDILHIVDQDPTLQFFIALGDNAKRRSLALNLEGHSIESPRLIHPRSVVSSSTYIGCGSLVVAGAVVNVGADIGRHCIVNSGAVVEHDCRIYDFVHIAPNATITGGVTVGEGSLIGAGATVLPGVKIGENVTVGAGAVVTKDVRDDTVVVGVPARVDDVTPRRAHGCECQSEIDPPSSN